MSQDDGPRDELEPGKIVEAEIGRLAREIGRLARHPRAETTRLKQVADDGEHGSAPFIEIALVARWVVPIALVLIGITLLVYFRA